MPKATIYIRVENWEYWQALMDKSEYVNDKLKAETQPKTVKEPQR